MLYKFLFQILNSKKSYNPIWWVSSVYFAMGLPFIALSVVSTLMFKDLGIDNTRIAFWTSLLTLPWSLKPFFSLIMETFGSKRLYVILTEAVSSLVFGVLVFALPMPNFFLYTVILMWVIAISGSIHDIAGDGIYMEELDKAQQSRYIGWQGAFYNMAKILSNGGLVFLAGWLSRRMLPVNAWQIVIGLFFAIMASVAIYHLWILPKGKPVKKNNSFNEDLQQLWAVFISFFKKNYIWIYLLFIVLYRFAEGLAMKIAPLFLTAPISKGGIGLTKQEYGLAYGTCGALAFVLGSVAGGWCISRFGLKKMLLPLVCVFNFPMAVFLMLAIFQPQSIVLVTTGITIEYLGYGFGFAGLMLFMMQQVAPGKYQMAHYAFANSFMNLSVMIPGMVSGRLSDIMGYKGFFIIVMLVVIPVLLLVKFVPFSHPDKQP